MIEQSEVTEVEKDGRTLEKLAIEPSVVEILSPFAVGFIWLRLTNPGV